MKRLQDISNCIFVVIRSSTPLLEKIGIEQGFHSTGYSKMHKVRVDRVNGHEGRLAENVEKKGIGGFHRSELALGE